MNVLEHVLYTQLNSINYNGFTFILLTHSYQYVLHLLRQIKHKWGTQSLPWSVFVVHQLGSLRHISSLNRGEKHLTHIATHT